MRKMDAYLVRSTRVQFDTYIGVRRESLKHRVMCDCGLAVVTNTHTFAVHSVATDRGINRSTSG